MISSYDRTPERPMAFGPGDLWRGAWTAWCVFMVMLLVVMTALTLPGGDIGLTTLALLYAVLIGGVVTLVMMLAFTPVAWLLGRALVRVRFVGVHVVVFTVLGAVVGLAVLLLVIATGADVESVFTSVWAWAMMGGSAFSVVTGWAHAARRSRRGDEPGGMSSRWSQAPQDRDAAYEDRALGS